jgi:aspartate/methionine/tyrosine aminotransferase
MQMTPSQSIRHMERSGIREIFDLANTIPDAIHLEMGEPNFDTPRHVVAAAAAAASNGYTKYTPNAGLPELRAAVARKVTERNGLTSSPEQVIVTPGAIAALYGTLLALCDSGDEILLPDPAWPNYRMIAALQGLQVGTYPLLTDSGRFDVDAFERSITSRSKVVVVNSPNNPTGTMLDEQSIKAMVQIADARGLWVISDEVYDEIVFDRDVAPSVAALGGSDNVVSVYSFSKTYAMTGWRVGYAVAPPDLVSYVVKTQEPITACVNAPAQMAAVAALDGPQTCVTEMRDAYRERRDRVVELLMDAGVPHLHPAAAFYVWVDVSASGLSGQDFARRLLHDHHVAVTPGGAFGRAGTDHVRLSLASAPADLYRGVKSLAAAVIGR